MDAVFFFWIFRQRGCNYQSTFVFSYLFFSAYNYHTLLQEGGWVGWRLGGWVGGEPSLE